MWKRLLYKMTISKESKNEVRFTKLFILITIIRVAPKLIFKELTLKMDKKDAK